MNRPPKLIFSSSNSNIQHFVIRNVSGWYTGSQLPAKLTFSPYFADQDWKKPKKEQYIEAVKQYKPCVATVIDWTHDVTYTTVLSWIEAITPFVQEVIVIPKIPGTIQQIPEKFILGYSVQSTYGSTEIDPSEFFGRRVHLLGGSPKKQLAFLLEFGISINWRYYCQVCYFGSDCYST